MKSSLANLLSLTLPAGAISGTRIVLDGITGLISFYDAGGQLVMQFGPSTFTAFARFYTQLAHETFPGRIYADNQFLAGALNLLSPDLGHGAWGVSLLVPDLDAGGAKPPMVQVKTINVSGGAQPIIDLTGDLGNAALVVASDYSLGSPAGGFQVPPNQGRSMPRGLVVAPLKGTANSGTAAIGAETKDTSTGMGDLVFTAVTGRRYRVSFQCHVNISVAAATEIEARIRDGGGSSPSTTSTLLFSTPDNLSIAGGSGQITLHAEAYLDCTNDIAAGTHTIAAFIAMTAGGGGGNALFAGSATQPKALAVEDVGPAIA